MRQTPLHLLRNLVLLTFVVGAPMAGCNKENMIPGTNIPDTEGNWEVLKVLERYRKAFVQLDPAGVLATAHPTYYDVSGTDDPGDDIVYQDLGAILRTRMAQLESVRFTIDYLDLHVDKHRATVHVWLDASFRLKPPVDEAGEARQRSTYARKQDYAVFELMLDGQSWLITRGL